VGHTVLGRPATVGLRIYIAALVTKHYVESDGKSFPSHKGLLGFCGDWAEASTLPVTQGRGDGTFLYFEISYLVD
jgi:hypothetical protein